ncbi:MAG: major capsid protein [Candidatus Riflebacteria bacterium]|nr:major capsid protein [Candidatus Riflebacteria bacterium]
MDNLFKIRVLTEAVNKIKTGTSLILDTVFSRKKMELSSRLAWDIISGNETLLKNLKVTDSASISNLIGRSNVICEAPRFAEKRMVTAAMFDNLRAFGEQDRPQLLAAKIAEEQLDMKGKIDRTREFMAAKALGGQVVDVDGKVLVDYNFSETQKPVLEGKKLWTDSESDPIKDIRGWVKLIKQSVNTVGRLAAFVATDVMDALLNHPKVLDLLKYTSGSQLAENGRIVHLAGVDLIEYNGSYILNGIRYDFIPSKYFVLIGIDRENAAELYAPVVDLDAPNGVGSGLAASMFFSKSWKVEDPSGRWIKVEARPLPVLFKPECIVYAKVLP